MDNYNQHPEDRGINTVSFFQQVQSLPPALHKRFMKQIAGSLAMAILTIVLMFYTKEVEYCWGFLFSIFIAYMGCSLVWNYADQKIICQPMVCITVSYKKVQGIIVLYMRDLDAPEMATNVTHEFRIPASKENLDVIKENTILNVYYNPKSPVEMLAWEIIGMAGAPGQR